MESVSKKEQLKKSEVLKELQQLKLKVQNLEREKSTHIYNKHSDNFKEFSQLQELETKNTEARKVEKIRLQQHLVRISSMVKKFHRELSDVRPTPEFVEKLKVIMEEIEGHISEYKNSQKEQYEEMMRDERLTSQEVAALDKKFDSWLQQGAATDRITATQARSGSALLSHRGTPRDLPPQVQAFERFLAQSGGPRGGWDEYDHSTFLKFRNRHKGKLGFLRELTMSLPTKTDVEIRQHEEWYQQYLSLNDKKKEAIQHWKERKELEKDEVLSRAGKEVEQEVESQRQHELIHQREQQEDRNQQRIQLNRWKVERELQKAQEVEKKLREELDKKKAEEVKKQVQAEKKLQLEEYKRSKALVEEEQRRERQWREIEEAEEKRRQAAELIPKYRERDLSSVKQKKAREQTKQLVEAERKQRIEEKLRHQVSLRVARDPSRLLQPTAGWRERQKEASPQGGGPVLHMPHRAVPSWRQGMH